jgi:hypothetical protein
VITTKKLSILDKLRLRKVTGRDFDAVVTRVPGCDLGTFMRHARSGRWYLAEVLDKPTKSWKTIRRVTRGADELERQWNGK